MAPKSSRLLYEALIKRFDVCRQSNYNRIHKSRGVFGVSMPCLDLISFTFCYCFCTGNPLMPHKTTEWPLKRPIVTPPPPTLSQERGLKDAKHHLSSKQRTGRSTTENTAIGCITWIHFGGSHVGYTSYSF